MKQVVKRDGQIVDFDQTKIENAVNAAFKAAYGKLFDDDCKISEEIATCISDSKADVMEVEDIQDKVEYLLMQYEEYKVAKAYIKYRYDRELKRKANTTDKTILELVRGENKYYKTENSNKNHKLVTTQRDYIAGETSRDLTMRVLLPKEIVRAHESGEIHFHDADYFLEDTRTNCSLINLKDQLDNGTVVNGKMIESPHKLLTAMTITTQIITAVASSQYGGTTVTMTHLAPYVRKSYEKYLRVYREMFEEEFDDPELVDKLVKKFADKALKKEIEDAVQTFNYQINSMSTTNGQTPFVTVFLYLGEDKEYTKEVAMLTEEFFKQRLLGIKNEAGVYVTQEFPKLIYVAEEQNIHEDSEYFWLTKLAAKCMAKRMVPDIISEKKMFELKEGNCFPSMGCRSFLAPWKNEKGEYQFYGRFNMGVVTINLVDVALSSHGDMEKFWEIFEDRLENLCHTALQCRINKLKGTLSDVAPILWQHGAFARLKKGEPIDKLMYGGYASISLGYAGLYECVKYMTGKSHTDGAEGEKFGLDVMDYMNKKCDQWKKEENIGYSIYGTPIESTTYKFAKSNRKKFGVIEGITDRDYITNSYHVPVFEEIDWFEKLRIESIFQAKSTGGAVSYVEGDDLQDNEDLVVQIIQYIYETILYAELNIKSDYCQVCGYEGEISLLEENEELVWECPCCHNRDQSKMNVTRRTCGYLGQNFWNLGRTWDIHDRVVHIKPIIYKPKSQSQLQETK